MKGFLCNKKCHLRIGFICCFAFLLCTFFSVFILDSNVSAYKVNRALAATTILKGTPNGSFARYTTGSGTLPYRIVQNNWVDNFLQIRLIEFSTALPQAMTGNQFYFKAQVGFSFGSGHINGIATGDFFCPLVENVYVLPEQGTLTSINYNIDSCESHTIFANDVATGVQASITISGSGTLVSSTSITSVIIGLSSSEAHPFVDMRFSQNPIYGYIINDVNLEGQVGTDDNLAVLGEINQNITNLNNSINNLNDTIENQSSDQTDAINHPEWVQEEQDALDDAVSDASDEAGDQAALSEAQGQPLVTIIRNFITAITNPIGGNCEILLDFTAWSPGAAREYVDLCHLSPPAWFNLVSSAFLVAFVVNAAVHVVQAMINLYKEYQT